MNKYISRYTKFDDAIVRTDPFKYAEWKEESEVSNFTKLSAGLGLILTLAAFYFISFI